MRRAISNDAMETRHLTHNSSSGSVSPGSTDSRSGSTSPEKKGSRLLSPRVTALRRSESSVTLQNSNANNKAIDSDTTTSHAQDDPSAPLISSEVRRAINDDGYGSTPTIIPSQQNKSLLYNYITNCIEVKRQSLQDLFDQRPSIGLLVTTLVLSYFILPLLSVAVATFTALNSLFAESNVSPSTLNTTDAWHDWWHNMTAFEDTESTVFSGSSLIINTIVFFACAPIALALVIKQFRNMKDSRQYRVKGMLVLTLSLMAVISPAANAYTNYSFILGLAISSFILAASMAFITRSIGADGFITSIYNLKECASPETLVQKEVAQELLKLKRNPEIDTFLQSQFRQGVLNTSLTRRIIECNDIDILLNHLLDQMAGIELAEPTKSEICKYAFTDGVSKFLLTLSTSAAGLSALIVFTYLGFNGINDISGGNLSDINWLYKTLLGLISGVPSVIFYVRTSLTVGDVMAKTLSSVRNADSHKEKFLLSFGIAVLGLLNLGAGTSGYNIAMRLLSNPIGREISHIPAGIPALGKLFVAMTYYSTTLVNSNISFKLFFASPKPKFVDELTLDNFIAILQNDPDSISKDTADRFRLFSQSRRLIEDQPPQRVLEHTNSGTGISAM